MKQRLSTLPALTLIVVGACTAASAEHSHSTGAIAGTVVDELNKRVSGVRVVLSMGLEGHKYAEATTDGRGEFLFADLPAGPFALAYYPPADSNLVGDEYSTGPHVPKSALRTLPGKVVRVLHTLALGGSLEVSISSPPAVASCPCRVTLRRAGASFDVEPEVNDRRLILRGVPPAGDYLVILEALGFATQRSSQVAVERGRATTVTFRYDPDDQTGIVGTLRAADGSALEGYTLVVLGGPTLAGVDAGHTRTGAGGAFALVGLDAGTYAVTLDGVVLASVVVHVGARTTVDLVWPGAARSRSGDLYPKGLEAASAGDGPLTPWPWPYAPELYKPAPGDDGSCVRVMLMTPADSLYRSVWPGLVEGAKGGLDCLSSRVPKRAARLRGLFEGKQKDWVFWPSVVKFIFDCSSSAGCAGTPPLGRKNTIWFDKSAPKGECVTVSGEKSCFSALVFHELLHLTSTGRSECVTWACTKMCFSCAPSVPRELDQGTAVKEQCGDCPACTEM